MIVRLETNAPDLFGELADVVRLFYPGAAVCEAGEAEICVRHRLEASAQSWRNRVSADGEERIFASERAGKGLAEARARKRAAKLAVYRLLREIRQADPPWGALTGIRPTRLLYEFLERGLDLRQALEALQSEFYVSPEKASLLGDVYHMQAGLREAAPPLFDLYIGIPFCTTRCAYCSFSSGELGDGRLVEPYVSALEREIRACGRMAAERGLSPRAAYMGGGTPTALSADQLSRVLAAAREAFPGAREWTVEAGRPDTITKEKLAALIAQGVERISVNPQTFSDETLRRIGRAHTAEDTLSAFALAREMGFGHINMDVIAALPGEGYEDFMRTLRRVIALAPESVTVHTLAIKRSSRLHEQLVTETADYAPPDSVGQMVSDARRMLSGSGYQPYYLYRQKYMAGNLENVGYAKEGYACLYNIGNMEETVRVMALGAGAISKWLFDRERRIERAPNVRNIEAYIDRVDEMIARKRALIGEDAP